MTNINRRAALIGAAASSLSLSLPAISSVRAKEAEAVHDTIRTVQALLRSNGWAWRVTITPDVVSIDPDPRQPGELAGLIETYDRLYAELGASAAELDEAQERAANIEGPLVPLSLTPQGNAPSGRLDLAKYDQADIEQRIREAHARLIETHITPYKEAMSPMGCEEMRRNLDDSLTRCLRALAEAVEQRAEAEARVGLTAADQHWDDANDALRSAERAIFGYVPTSADEAVEKAEWMAAHYAQNHFVEPDQMEALIQSIAGKAVA